MARQIETWQRSNVPNSVPSPIVPSGRSGLAEGLGELASQVDRYAQGRARVEDAQRQKKKDDDAAKASKSFAESSMITNMGIQELELNAKPGGEGHRQAVEKLIDEEQKRVAGTITDPEILEQMNNKFFAMKAQFIPEAMGFEAHAGIEKRVSDFQDGFDSARNLVASNPAQFSLQLENQYQGIAAMRIPDARKESLRKYVEQQLAASAIGGKLNSKPRETLAELQSGSWDNLVNPDQKLGFINQAESELKRRDAEAKAAAAQARMESQLDLQLMADDATTNAKATGRYDGNYEATIRRAYGDKPQRAQKILEGYRADVAIGQNSVTFTTMPNAERAAAIESLKPKDGSQTYANDDRVYQAAIQKDQAIRTALKKDPAGYILETNSIAKAAWRRVEEAKDPSEMEFLTKEAVETTKQLQRDMGVPEWEINTLAGQQAAAITAEINNPGATADEIKAKIAAVNAAHGGKGVAELVKTGSKLTSFGVAFADQPQDANWVGRLLEWEKVSDEDQKAQLKARLSASSVKPDAVDTALSKEMAPFIGTMPSGSSAPYIESARKVMEYNIVKRHMDPPQAAADATAIFKDKYSINGTYRVPSNYNGDTISYGLTNVISNIRSTKVGGAGSADSTLPKEFLTEQLQEYISDGRTTWRNASSADGNQEIGVMMMIDDLNPVLVDGKPFVLTWDQIASKANFTSGYSDPATGWTP